MSVFVSSDGNTGPIVSVSKALLLSAHYWIRTTCRQGRRARDHSTKRQLQCRRRHNLRSSKFGRNDQSSPTFPLVSSLRQSKTSRPFGRTTERRCQGCSSQKKCHQETNLVAAMGRITDADIAAESTRMAKYNVLSSLGRHAVPGELEHRSPHSCSRGVTPRARSFKFNNRLSSSSIQTGRTYGHGSPKKQCPKLIKEESNYATTINTNSAASAANLLPFTQSVRPAEESDEALKRQSDHSTRGRRRRPSATLHE